MLAAECGLSDDSEDPEEMQHLIRIYTVCICLILKMLGMNFLH